MSVNITKEQWDNAVKIANHWLGLIERGTPPEETGDPSELALAACMMASAGALEAGWNEYTTINVVGKVYQAQAMPPSAKRALMKKENSK